MQKIVLKKAGTLVLTIMIFSVAFLPSTHSQIETKIIQMLETNTSQDRSIEIQQNTPYPPTLDGRLDDTYHTHGTRIYYGNITYPNAHANLYVIDNTTIDPDSVWIAWILNPYFVDNTYGNGTVPQYRNQNGLPCGHTLNDLNESDKQDIKLYNSSGLVFHASLDLLQNVGNTTVSGYGIPTWGNGESMVYYGTPNFITYTTSTSFNVNYYYNTTPYNVLTDSPTLGDQNYTLYLGYEEWEHRLIYELKVNRSLFGQESMDIYATEFPNIHASPNKIGPHTIPLNPLYGSLGDYVWDDLNKDGIQNSNETGLSNVTVLLYHFYKDNNATIIDSTITNTSGYYMFDNLGPGDYYLKFFLPNGYRFTLPDQTDDTHDSDANTLTGETIPISLSPGENDYTWDAGMYLEEYTLDILIIGQGTVETYPNPPYTYGTIVHLTAIPHLGWSFSHWSGDVSGTSPMTTVTITENTSVTAHFIQEIYTLTITVDPDAGGSVSADPVPPYYYGTVVTLTATENPGYSFSHWSGDASGSNPITTVTMNGNRSVTAHFIQNTYTLTITVTPDAGGSVSADPVPPYYYGTVVTLTATENPGYSFSHWSGDASGTSPATTVTMTGNKSVTAHFTQHIYTLTIHIDPASGGSVTAAPNGPYHYGDVVTLTAVENPRYAFSHWSGDVTGNQNPQTITMTSNKTVTAHFTSTEDTEPPLIHITKPKNALYVLNNEILSVPTIPIIIYMITIEVNATDNESGIDRVEFFINGVVRSTDTSAPYSYDWRTIRSGKHTIQIKAYDKAGNSATSPDLVVFKWRLHPILIFPLLTLAVLLTYRPF